ncbi:MAG: type II secretion protein F [Euryarchaeota archaeon]|nr:type II secretion protein F [Euryarchaeota archaeon]
MSIFAKLFGKYAPKPAEGMKYKIKLPKGSLPTYINLSPYYRLAWKVMGKKAEANAKDKKYAKLESDLIKAHMLVRPQEYIAYMYFTILIAAIAGAVGGAALIILSILKLSGTTEMLMVMMGLGAAILPPVALYLILPSSPGSKAKKRAKDIDAHLAAAMNFIASLSSADVTIATIFKELATREEYGEIASEAEWITRDTELLGKDILTAIADASKRSPSTKWQEFLQGVITTATSGGRLKPFFLTKSDEYEKEEKLNLRKKMENLGLFAEIYVTVGVAFPLFLVVILAIMALINASSSAMVVMVLEVTVVVMIPMIIFVFSYFIYSTSKEV